MTTARFFLERVDFGERINLHMALKDHDFYRSVAQPVIFEARKEADGPTSPMLQLTPEQAQNLMDELWTVGFRPTQGQQSEGQMGATTNHLNDMRAIVSALAKVQLP
jgi:hypothetical protein